MANTFHQAILIYEKIGHIPEHTVWVEIGSERGEGSTLGLAGQAQRWGTMLHSVDISDSAKNNLTHPALHCWVDKGSEWCRQVFPGLAKKISLLYLDNFDWIWNVEHVPDWIQQQIHQYQNQYGIVMNNQQCQQEHLAQVYYLLPYLCESCVVAMDDTWLEKGVWTGKCGSAVALLSVAGFKIAYTNGNGGTVMVRGFPMISIIDTDRKIYS